MPFRVAGASFDSVSSCRVVQQLQQHRHRVRDVRPAARQPVQQVEAVEGGDQGAAWAPGESVLTIEYNSSRSDREVRFRMGPGQR